MLLGGKRMKAVPAAQNYFIKWKNMEDQMKESEEMVQKYETLYRS